MAFYIVQFLTGLASAASLFLVASGLSIIFGVTRIVNFAHGAFYMLGAYLAFNGYQTSTMNFQTFSQVAFAFRVTPQLFATGLFYALAIGLIGGLLPAIRAARLPISLALREL